MVSPVLSRAVVVLGSEVFLLFVLMLTFGIIGKHLTLAHYFVCAAIATPVFIFSSFKAFPTTEENDDDSTD